jgi:acetyl-CoA carboxylase carboxyltransferase component
MEREEELQEKREEIKTGGPERGHDKLEELNKLFVRDRLDLYFDGDEPYFETGLFARNQEDELPADGVVTGTGEIDDRLVFFAANDYTVKAGSIGDMHGEKILRMQERASEAKRPLLYLIDSSGARIDEAAGYHAAKGSAGSLFYNHSRLSGRVPQIGVLYGPCFAGTAYTPVFCDFTIMVEGMAGMAIASPRMVKMATGQEISIQELGGPEMHAKKSGSIDFVVEDEEEAAEVSKQLLTYLPDSYDEPVERQEPQPPETSPGEIDDIIPEHPNAPYDMHDVIDATVDEGSFLEVQKEYAKELIVGFGRLDGRTVGVIANQPKVKGGSIFPKSADKGAEFVWLCDAYNIPLLYLCDTPGFMVGSSVEEQGILRRGRKFIFATSSATVPKMCVVVRKAYGAGIYAMCGPAYEPEATLALPSAEIAVMGPEAAINAVYYNKIQDIEDKEARKQKVKELREEYRDGYDIYKLADDMVVDDITPPTDLRKELIHQYRAFEKKDFENPDRKHSTILS